MLALKRVPGHLLWAEFEGAMKRSQVHLGDTGAEGTYTSFTRYVLRRQQSSHNALPPSTVWRSLSRNGGELAPPQNPLYTPVS